MGTLCSGTPSNSHVSRPPRRQRCLQITRIEKGEQTEEEIAIGIGGGHDTVSQTSGASRGHLDSDVGVRPRDHELHRYDYRIAPRPMQQRPSWHNVRLRSWFQRLQFSTSLEPLVTLAKRVNIAAFGCHEAERTQSGNVKARPDRFGDWWPQIGDVKLSCSRRGPGDRSRSERFSRQDPRIGDLSCSDAKTWESLLACGIPCMYATIQLRTYTRP